MNRDPKRVTGEDIRDVIVAGVIQGVTATISEQVTRWYLNQPRGDPMYREAGWQRPASSINVEDVDLTPPPVEPKYAREYVGLPSADRRGQSTNGSPSTDQPSRSTGGLPIERSASAPASHNMSHSAVRAAQQGAPRDTQTRDMRTVPHPASTDLRDFAEAVSDFTGSLARAASSVSSAASMYANADYVVVVKTKPRTRAPRCVVVDCPRDKICDKCHCCLHACGC